MTIERVCRACLGVGFTTPERERRAWQMAFIAGLLIGGVVAAVGFVLVTLITPVRYNPSRIRYYYESAVGTGVAVDDYLPESTATQDTSR